MDRRALGARDDVGHIRDQPRIRNAHLGHAGAEALQHGHRTAHAGFHLGVEAMEVVVLRHADAKPGDGMSEGRRVVGRGAGTRGRILRVSAGDDPEQERHIPHRQRHGAHVVHGPGQRHDSRAAHAAVGGLESDDAATARRQPDGAARVGAEGAHGQPSGHRGARAARGAARAVPRTPWVLDVPVVGVVAERAHGQLRHVELAQRHGTRPDQTADRGALGLGEEVVGRLRPAGGRQAADVTEVLEGERHPVERAAPAPGARVGLEGAGGRQRALGIQRDEGAQPPVESRDAIEAGARRLHRGEAPRADVGGDGGERPVGHDAAASDGAPGP